MIQIIKKLLGFKPKANFAQLIKEDGVIIDVRTKAEYQQGHIKGSINIPLNNLSNHYAKLQKEQPIITCCASGIRSASAKNILQSNGFTNVHNGGAWSRLKNKI
jgi:rhodanese-related sulfurtransferase